MPRISVLYSSAAKKNLPAEEPSEEVTFHPSYLSGFDKEHFHRENVMPDQSYTAFFSAPSSPFTTKHIFDALLTDGIPASAVRCLQRSPNGKVFITFTLQKYRDLFLRRSSFVVRRSQYVAHVTVYDAPHELPDSAVEHGFGRYGRIFSTHHGKVQGYPNVFNGLRHLHMELDTHIPCFLRLGKVPNSGEFYVFNEFVSLSRDKISLEKYIFCMAGREKDFKTKWSVFSSLLNTV